MKEVIIRLEEEFLEFCEQLADDRGFSLEELFKYAVCVMPEDDITLSLEKEFDESLAELR
jgi:hypothetical protein